MISRHSMASMKRRKQMMYLFSGFLFLCALAIALMPLGNEMKDKTMLIMYCSGAAFWVGIIGTIYMALKINRSRKGSYRFNELFGNRKQLGLIHFFQNTEALIVDVAMIISLIALIIARLCSANLQVIYVIIAVFVFAFGMHCMLNGMNYKYINYSKYVKEQKKDE